MKTSLLEYAATDDYIMLFLSTGNLMELIPQGPAGYGPDPLVVIKCNYDQDLVKVLEQDGVEIPDAIDVNGAKFELDDDGELHSLKQSFSSNYFQLKWINQRGHFHRENGPALIKFNGYETHHIHGRFKGFRSTSWSAKWFINGRMTRTSGPHSVTGSDTEVIISRSGEINSIKPIQLTHLWNHPGGGNIGPSKKISEALRKNEIKLNLFDPGPSVFIDEMDEVIFYASVG